MMKRNLIIFLIAIILWGSGCASHPPVFPQMPEKDVTNMGITFSVEMSIENPYHQEREKVEFWNALWSEAQHKMGI